MSLIEAWEGMLWLGELIVICTPFYVVYQWFQERGTKRQREEEFDQWMRTHEARRG